MLKKSTFVAALIFVAAGANAASPAIPKEFHGKWAKTVNVKVCSQFAEFGAPVQEGSRITGTGIVEYESFCELKKVISYKKSSSFKGLFACSEEGGSTDAEISLSINAKGQVSIGDSGPLMACK